MMLAAELALAGVEAVVLERRPSAEIESARGRAGGLHARTIEVLDQRGVAERFLEEGEAMQVAAFAGVTLDLGDFPTRHPYGLALWQKHTERILGEWASEVGVVTQYGRELTGLTQDDDGVDIHLADGNTLRAGYVVGCDGGRSLVRKLAGIDFPGWGPSVSSIIAEVEMQGEPEFGFRNDALGVNAMRPLEGGRVGVVVRDANLDRESDLTLEDLRAAIVAVWGSDFGLVSADMISRFTDATRQAANYRNGRVLLAGDAAHIHYPAGGQGLNLGVQDAVNLGWKLAQVVTGAAPADLLDTYHAERHPVAARVLKYTMALTALQRGDDRTSALIEIVGDLLDIAEARERIAGLASGLDIHYDLGDGPSTARAPHARPRPRHRRRPAAGLHVAAHAHVPCCSTSASPARSTSLRGRIGCKRLTRPMSGAWELPVLGRVPAPTAVLIRPDGYVAWVGEGSDAGLADALATWFGPPVRRSWRSARRRNSFNPWRPADRSPAWPGR